MYRLIRIIRFLPAVIGVDTTLPNVVDNVSDILAVNIRQRRREDGCYHVIGIFNRRLGYDGCHSVSNPNSVGVYQRCPRRLKRIQRVSTAAELVDIVVGNAGRPLIPAYDCVDGIPVRVRQPVKRWLYCVLVRRNRIVYQGTFGDLPSGF